jgi:hypothetical protein
MHIQQGMGRSTSESVMDLFINMGESYYRFLCYHYVDLKVLIITSDVKLRHSSVRSTQINNTK